MRLCIPAGFLTAVLQNYARLNKISVDSLTFVHKVLPFTQNKEQDLRTVKRKEYIFKKAFQVRKPDNIERVICISVLLKGRNWEYLGV